MIVNTLEFEMAANVARLRQDMAQVSLIMQGAMEKVQRAANFAGSAMGYLGVALSVDSVRQQAKAAIDLADSMNDIADATGASVEKISELATIARRNGATIDTLTTAMIKFNKSLTESADASTIPARAIEAVGLQAKTLREMDPALAMRELAKALGGFENDQNKAQVVTALFGKSLKEVAPLLNDLANGAGATGRVTAETAAQAEAFNKALARAKTAGEDLTVQLAVGLSPALIEVLDAMGRSAEEAQSFADDVVDVIRVPVEAVAVLGAYVSDTFRGVGREIGAIAAQVVALGRLDIAGFNAISSALKEDNKRAAVELDLFTSRVLSAVDKARQMRAALSNPEQNYDSNPLLRINKPTLRNLAAEEEAEKRAKEYQRVVDQINGGLNRRIELIGVELELGRAMSEAERAQFELKQQIESASLKILGVDRRRMEATAARLASMLKERDLEQQLAKDRESRFDVVDALYAQTQAVMDQVVAEQLAREEIGKTGLALSQLQVIRLTDAAAEAERRAVMADPINERLAKQYRDQAQALRSLASARALTGLAADNARLRAQEFDKLTDKASKLDSFLAKDYGANFAAGFDRASAALGNFVKGFETLMDAQKEYNQQREEYSGNAFELAKIEAKQQANQVQIYGNLTAAAKGFFQEGTTGYVRLQQLEQIFRATELALAVKATATKLGLLGTETSAKVASDATKAASEGGYTLLSVAQSGIRAAASGVEAVVRAIASMPFPLNLAAGAATAAAITALGVRISGGPGGGSVLPMNTGTGTILGMPAAKSESVERSIEALQQLKSINGSVLGVSQQMLASLRNIEVSLGGVASLIVRRDVVGGVTGSIATGTVSKSLGGIFSTGQNVGAAGLVAESQTLGVIEQLGLAVKAFADVTRSGRFLGVTYSQSTSTQLNPVDQAISQQFTKILLGFGESVAKAGTLVGYSLDDLKLKIGLVPVELGRIDLKGLTGQQIEERLSAVFGAAGDRIAQAAVPGLEQFQKVGEGYLETLVRVASTTESVRKAFSTLGINFGQAADGFFSLAQGLFDKVVPSVEYAQRLVESFGGIEQFTASITSFYEAFYSEQERTARLTQQLTEHFASLGQALPVDRMEFRSRVEKALAQGNEELARQLLDVSAALDKVLPGFDAVGTVIRDAADILSERQNLERELLNLQGDTAALLAIERASIDQSNRALFDRIQALKAEQASAQQAAAAMERIASQRLGLERQLLELQGNQAALLALDRAALDDSNRALFDRIQALRIERTAAEEAAATMERIASQRTGLERQLLELQGDTAEIRRRELAAIDPSNRALQQQIFALQDAKAAMDQYNTALASARSAVEAAANAVLTAQGTVDGIREQATTGYLAALERVSQVQDRIAQRARDVAIEYGRLADSLYGYLSQQVSTPSQMFASALKSALAGDRQAMGALPGLAGSAMDSARASAQDSLQADLARLRILSDVRRVAELANSQRAAELDEAAQLQQELTNAQREVAAALRVANAIQAPLVKTQEDLIQKFGTSQQKLTEAIQTQARAQAALDAIRANTGLINTNVQSGNDALIRALVAGFDSVDLNVDGLINYQEFSSALSFLANEETLRKVFRELDINGDGMIDKLEAIRLRVGDVALNTAGTRVVEFSASDPLRSVFNNISRTNSLVLKSQEIFVRQLMGLSPTAAREFVENDVVPTQNSGGFTGTYTLQLQIAEHLKVMRDLASSGSGLRVAMQSAGASSATSMAVTNQGWSESLAAIRVATESAADRLSTIVTHTQNTSIHAFNGADTIIKIGNRTLKPQVVFDRGTGATAQNPGGAVFATGGAFTNSIVRRPTFFDLGLMGEKTPEAILPLANINGNLGVRAAIPAAAPSIDMTRAIRVLSAMQGTLDQIRDHSRRIDVATNGRPDAPVPTEVVS